MSNFYSQKPWRKNYPEEVSSSLNYSEYPLNHNLDKAAEEFPRKEALIFYNQSFSYEEFKELSNKFASALQKIGVKKRDRVTILLPNCPQFAIVFYGALKAGAVPSPLNPLYTRRELLPLLKDSKPKAIVSLKSFYPRLKGIQKETEIETIILSDLSNYLPFHLKALLKLKNLFSVDLRPNKEIKGFEELLEKSSKNFEPKDIEPKKDLACLMYTSGTTGKPRGVPLTHYNLTTNLKQIKEYIGSSLKTGEEVQLGVLPFFHVYGLTFVLNFSVKRTFKIVLFPKFHSKPSCKAIDEHEITVVPGVPAIFSALLRTYNEKDKQYDFSSVKFWGSGAAPCPDALTKKLRNLTEAIFIEAYGLTETSPITHMNPLQGKQKEGSIGLPLPDTECKIVDTETGEEKPPNEKGELLIKGPQVFNGYWNSPEASQEVLTKEKWFHTQDIASVDSEGYFKVYGRLDDMINVRGKKVWPRQIEQVLEDHPEIQEAGVIGIEHDYFGQAPKAFVVTEEGIEGSKRLEKKIINFCKKHLTKHKIPEEIEFISEVPKSHIGKVLHYELRQRN